MTLEGALYLFFNTAIPGVPAYVETAVPSKANGDAIDAVMPYLTYNVPDVGFGEESSLPVNIWFHTQSEAAINAAKTTLYTLIGTGGSVVHYDGGAVWLKRGVPFSNNVYTGDSTLKRRYINLIMEKLSEK